MAEVGVVDEFIQASAPHRWRVLMSGTGPVALCLHGAGGSGDSFRPLMAQMDRDLTLIAPDLPGHGGTRLGAAFRSGLKEMAEDVQNLVAALDVRPTLIIGHSAGAAISLELDQLLSPRGHVLINAALGEFEGIAGWVFPMMAKALAATPFSADLMARRLSDARVLRRLLGSTGSDVTPAIFNRYANLAKSRDHIAGTLRMMAAWNLSDLLNRLDRIETPVCLIAGTGDRTVPDTVSKSAEKSLKDAQLWLHPGGHLLHEEAPDVVAADILTFLDAVLDQSA